jgi:hypothetical protein
MRILRYLNVSKHKLLELVKLILRQRLKKLLQLKKIGERMEDGQNFLGQIRIRKVYFFLGHKMFFLKKNLI